MHILIGLEAKGLLAFQGRRGIASVVQWNLRPVIFGVDWCGRPRFSAQASMTRSVLKELSTKSLRCFFWEEVVGVPLEGHSDFEQISLNWSKLILRFLG